MKIYSKRRALRIVSKHGYELYRVANQTEEICLAAVKNDGFALRYVRQQTPEICLAAVANYGNALQFVENQTEDICFAAVKQNPQAIKYVRNQTEEICRFAVMRDWHAIKCVRNQTEAICMAAIANDPAAVDCICLGNLTPRVLYYAAASYLSSLAIDIDSLIDNHIAERDKSAVSTPKVLTVGDIASKIQYEPIYVYRGSLVDQRVNGTEIFKGNVNDLPKECTNLEIVGIGMGCEDILIQVK